MNFGNSSLDMDGSAGLCGSDAGRGTDGDVGECWGDDVRLESTEEMHGAGDTEVSEDSGDRAKGAKSAGNVTPEPIGESGEGSTEAKGGSGSEVSGAVGPVRTERCGGALRARVGKAEDVARVVQDKGGLGKSNMSTG